MTGRSRVGPRIRVYRGWTRLKQAGFTRFVRSDFAAFGAGSVIMPPCSIDSASHVSIGSGVVLGPYCKLLGLGGPAVGEIRIVLADRVSIQGFCTLSAHESIVIGAGAMFARGVYISDHDHAYEDVNLAVRDQGVKNIQPVVVGAGSWLGENVVVCPGVTIGVGAVVAAHSVVRQDVPDYTLAAGAPARALRNWAPTAVHS